MTSRRPGSDYCPQCHSDYQWLQVSPEHRERLFCTCQWAARLRQVDSALLEELRASGDDVARRELVRRMVHAGPA